MTTHKHTNDTAIRPDNEPIVTIGVVLVYDPTTGLATHPVATAAWTPHEVLRWTWMPQDPFAERLRYGVIITLPAPADQAAWLSQYRDRPEIATYVVQELGTTTAATAKHDCDQALIEVIEEVL